MRTCRVLVMMPPDLQPSGREEGFPLFTRTREEETRRSRFFLSSAPREV
jgi:hypothetical protein